MKNIIVLSILCIICLAGCGDNYERGRVSYKSIIPEENVEKAAAHITEWCEAANPKSDEEGEDLLEQAEETAMKLYGKKVIGVWMQHGNEFVPYDDLGEYDKKRCDQFIKGE